MTAERRLIEGMFIGSHAVSEGWLTVKQLRNGPYRRLLHNVYADAVTAVRVDHQLRARAAALLMPPIAALGGRSAAAWYGAPFAGDDETVLVVAPAGCPWTGPAGVRVHTTGLRPEEVSTHDDGVRLTTALRTAWDVATMESISGAVALLDGMLRAGAVTEEALAREFSRRRATWRSTRADRVLPLLDGRAMSPPESRFRVAFALAGLPAPELQGPIEEGGLWIGNPDFVWRDQRVVVEYEGEYHFDAEQIRKDDVRYARLVAAGWTVIRLSSYDSRHMDQVVARVAAALGVDLHAR